MWYVFMIYYPLIPLDFLLKFNSELLFEFSSSQLMQERVTSTTEGNGLCVISPCSFGFDMMGVGIAPLTGTTMILTNLLKVPLVLHPLYFRNWIHRHNAPKERARKNRNNPTILKVWSVSRRMDNGTPTVSCVSLHTFQTLIFFHTSDIEVYRLKVWVGTWPSSWTLPCTIFSTTSTMTLNVYSSMPCSK